MIETGQILNNTYRIIETLGSGSGGIIFKAEHLRIKKYVAIKLVKENIKEVLDSRSEVDVLKNLKNDYIPQVLDFAEDGNDIYTVMEFIEGKDFNALISSGIQYSEEQVRKYALQLCSAVKYLHSHVPPIIHSDIKPSNIMLTPQDNICLIDFNISMITRNGAAAAMGGSRGFGAPEQFRQVIAVPAAVDNFHEQTRFMENEPTEILTDDEANAAVEQKTHNMSKAFIDIRTDIYGMGATLYYLLTSRVPSTGNLDFRGIRCSLQMMSIIRKAMEADPKKRLKNVTELEEHLNHKYKVKLQQNNSVKSRKKDKPQKSGVRRSIAVLAGITALSAAGVIVINSLPDNEEKVAPLQTSQKMLVEHYYEPAIKEFDKTLPVVSDTDITAQSVQNTEQTETSAPETKAAEETTTETTTETQPPEEFITIKGETYSTYLTELDLSGKGLTDEDIKPLAKMTNLTRLYLYNNQISDISSLSALTNLTVLGLDGNQISDISSLSALTNLTYLDLDDNQLSDISSLSALTNLTSLGLGGNQISDISSLSALTNLT